jgi:hypothetical protein
MYMAFIWIELFGHPGPRGLGLILIAYTLISIGGGYLFGVQAWHRYGEFFAVFLGLIARIAPLQYVPSSGPAASIRLRLRRPFVGLLEEPADHFSLLLFVLFMLSSTAFDGVHETVPWVGLFWKGLYPLLSSMIDLPYLAWVNVYYAWQWAMLFLSPFVYLGVYLVFIGLMRVLTGTGRSVRELALRFALSLVPIAVVYHVTHYFTLLVTQGPAIVPQLSDPFGLGWNLFGTAAWNTSQVILLAGTVWHIQVGLILTGHIVSVYLAHLEALDLFREERQALWSQLPMLVLMVVFTTMGLWILSLPIAAGQVQDPLPTGGSVPPSSIACRHCGAAAPG